MRVLKRDGREELVSFDKVLKRISYLCKDLNIDPAIIAQSVNSRIYDKVKTSELDELAAELCISKSTTLSDYAILASRIIISNNHKNTSPSFSETISILYQNIDETTGLRNPLVSKELFDIVHKNKKKLNSVIDYERDYEFDFFAFKTLEKAYLLKVNGQVVERIQHLFLRVSLGLHLNDYTNAIECYHAMSQKYFIHATPTLYHSGTNHMQLASCYLLGTDDSIDGIYKTISDCAQISKWAGGIGIHVNNIRSSGSVIKGTNGKSTGIIPMLRVYNETARYVNQGGKRPGSIAVYLEPHHPEIIEFLQLRKNHGAESERARDLFLALWISDLFMEKVVNNEDWYLMDPGECPGLNDVYGEEYKALYNKYVEEKKYRKSVKAQEIWKHIAASQIETGTPYILYKDHINNKSNQKNVGTIKSSNLCAEILEYSDSSEYAVCTLASMGLPKYVEKDENGTTFFNHKKLGEMIEIVVKNLNRVIDINFYPVPETKRSNMRHRPMGIGVQGLADVFALMRLEFESEEALNLNQDIFETMYYYSIKASCELSKKDGPYETFTGSPMSEGKFQFDMWGATPRNVNKYDWDSLRKDVRENGIRNSLLIACMPTASTSQILGNNECIEPFTSNIYSRRTIAGDFVILNKHLIKDLTDLGIWSEELKNMIIRNNGSIQNINIIPENIKRLYKIVWEMKQKSIIKMAVARAPFVCQTQSMNLFFEEPNTNVLISSSIYAWKEGLKTGSYYIRSRPKIQAQQFTIDPSKEDECEMCSG